jgi:hypothetical protein
MRYFQLLVIGESCPNLSQLWLNLKRLDEDLHEPSRQSFGADHHPSSSSLARIGVSGSVRRNVGMFRSHHFKVLKILYLKVGSEWSDDAGVKKDVFVYLTKVRSCVL